MVHMGGQCSPRRHGLLNENISASKICQYKLLVRVAQDFLKITQDIAIGLVFPLGW